MSADGIILATNQPVMAMGGFMGADPILKPDELAELVNDGTVRYFLLNNPASFSFFGANRATRSGSAHATEITPRRNVGFFGRGFQNGLTTWVTQHCATVPASSWQASTSGRVGSATALYDCAEKK
jgi:4-amino-4-deoxy-L-arabinose transferase-like glycosyltransferase